MEYFRQKPLTNSCNTMLDTTKKFLSTELMLEWRYVNKWIIYILFLKYFIWKFVLWFTFSYIKSNTSPLHNLSLYFVLREGMI